MEKRLEQNLSGEEHVQELLKEVTSSLQTAPVGEGVGTLQISYDPRAAEPEGPQAAGRKEHSLLLLTVL